MSDLETLLAREAGMGSYESAWDFTLSLAGLFRAVSQPVPLVVGIRLMQGGPRQHFPAQAQVVAQVTRDIPPQASPTLVETPGNVGKRIELGLGPFVAI